MKALVRQPCTRKIRFDCKQLTKYIAYVKLGWGGGGGGYFKTFMTGCAGRTLKTPSPYLYNIVNINIKPENHTYLYNMT